LDHQEDRTLEFQLMNLLENVNKLTQPYTDRVSQDQDGHHTTVLVRQPALVDQLANAVYSTQNAAGRGGGLASQRSVLDASALMLQDAIRNSLTRIWSRYSHKQVPADLKQAIRQFHVIFRTITVDRKLNPKTVWAVVHTTDRWVSQIEMKLDPPVTLEVTRPCPKCETQHVYNESNEQVSAVIITWHKAFDKSIATCRACDHSWVGESELRQLRWEIDERDTPNTSK
jgi:hypothetical protein